MGALISAKYDCIFGPQGLNTLGSSRNLIVRNDCVQYCWC